MELSIQNLESDVEEKQVVNVKCALKFRSIKCMGKVHNKGVIGVSGDGGASRRADL